jgi:hypothetical protein
VAGGQGREGVEVTKREGILGADGKHHYYFDAYDAGFDGCSACHRVGWPCQPVRERDEAVRLEDWIAGGAR